MAVTDEAPEPWVAVGYFALSMHKPTRAMFFAQKVSFEITNLLLCFCVVAIPFQYHV